RPADGSDALGVDAVVDKYADEVRGKGLDFGAANDEAAWKSEFRELVQQLADKLEAEEAGAHRAVLDNELGVNSNPVVDPNKQQLTAEDLAAPFAQHRDEVAEREAAEELAESKSAAVAAIEGAVHLTENQKSQFVDRINASAVVADVAAVLDQAHKLVDKQAAEEADKGTLAKDKGEAHRIIDGLNKLSTEQKAAFKKQVDDANTGAYVAHIVERAQEMNAQQHPSDDGAGAQEPGKPGNNETPGKPGSDNKPGQDQKPGSTTDAFKGFFGLAAGLGVFALIFGGILHTINHFDGFGVVQEHVRNAFAKIGIRF
ncbi:GA module-containing protein, partial [Corynebacterium pseudodiphtheriticum]